MDYKSAEEFMQISENQHKEILKRIICQIIKKVGFQSIELRALELMVEVFSDRLCSFLKYASQKTLISSKPTTTLIDLFSMNNKLMRIGKELLFTREMLDECNVSTQECKFTVNQELLSHVMIPIEYYEEDIIEPSNSEWISPLSTKIDKCIYIYDFMPNFPAIHTFRVTPMKTSSSKHMSTKVKNRLEQSLSSEGNMVKLIKSSGTMPKFINFMYRGKI